ncbi:MAG TPA: 50S ribosomal protein L15 [Phycisphaerae bacterium]|nr:50S ribosomal protein L15 [Phycisphaerae bacterium]
MNLDEILHAAGKSKRRTRVGRGTGSGHGKTCGRGHKGYHSRSGSGQRLGFEGGQTPVFARVPKRGFSNAPFKVDFQTVNVWQLSRFSDGARVDAAAMEEAGLIQDARKPVKVLGDGELSRKLTVAAGKFTAAAAAKITQAGGTVEQV